MTVQIDGLTDAQAIALEDMLATWMSLGSMGASRWTAFYADGDGNFHPKITVDGRKPQQTALVDKGKRWHKPPADSTEMYWIDFDWIAWKLRDDK